MYYYSIYIDIKAYTTQKSVKNFNAQTFFII